MARQTIPVDLPTRIARKITVNVDTGCWEWASAPDKDGYGKFKYHGIGLRPHRVVYELAIGAIPDGFVIDHLCRTRNCVNPAHLRAVSDRVNLFAPGSLAPAFSNSLKTHCHKGHPFDDANTYWVGGERRNCRACGREAQARYRAKQLMEAASPLR